MLFEIVMNDETLKPSMYKMAQKLAHFCMPY